MNGLGMYEEARILWWKKMKDNVTALQERIQVFGLERGLARDKIDNS